MTDLNVFVLVNVQSKLWVLHCAKRGVYMSPCVVSLFHVNLSVTAGSLVLYRCCSITAQCTNILMAVLCHAVQMCCDVGVGEVGDRDDHPWGCDVGDKGTLPPLQVEMKKTVLQFQGSPPCALRLHKKLCCLVVLWTTDECWDYSAVSHFLTAINIASAFWFLSQIWPAHV